MEDNKDQQDVDLENNDSEQDEEQASSEAQKALEAKVKELESSNRVAEAEAAKWRRIAAKKDKGDKEDKPNVDVQKHDSESKSDDLDYGEKAYLRSAINLKGADELQLAKEWKAKYDMTVDEMETDEVFLSRLTKLRETRETQNATPEGKKRTGQQGVTDVDIAYAKFLESGDLPEDFETRSAIVKRHTEKEKVGHRFSGPAVIGPQK